MREMQCYAAIQKHAVLAKHSKDRLG